MEKKEPEDNRRGKEDEKDDIKKGPVTRKKRRRDVKDQKKPKTTKPDDFKEHPAPKKRRRREEDGGKRPKNSMKPCGYQPELSQGQCSVRPARLRPSLGTPLSVERFTLHKTIGSGSFGKVILASEKTTKDLLALKIVWKVDVICEGPDTALIEHRVLKIVSGNRFCTNLHGTFQTQSQLCYAMEYLHGGDLDTFIKGNTLTISTARFFAAELVCGLNFLHGQGIIHRDLKPQNILLDTVGHIKIADFGLAFHLTDGMMSAEEYVGTEGYIAPEIRRGRRYTTAVDWWSYGSILEEMDKRLRQLEDPEFTEWESLVMKDVTINLSADDPIVRMGFVVLIPFHTFFHSIDWDKIENGEGVPPFIHSRPPLESLTSMVMKNRPIVDHPAPLSDQEKELFVGFSYINPQSNIFHQSTAAD